jgi:hypothetical protein
MSKFDFVAGSVIVDSLGENTFREILEEFGAIQIVKRSI